MAKSAKPKEQLEEEKYIPETAIQPPDTKVAIESLEETISTTETTQVEDEVEITEKERLPEQVKYEVPISEVVSEIPVWGIPPEEEIEFLKNILQIQSEGCFGTHLNGMINDRIKKLQGNAQ